MSTLPGIKKVRRSQPPASLPGTLLPVAPESSGAVPQKKRKRLAKAFSRPLDKKIREPERGQVKVFLGDEEYAQLVALQRRLAAQGVVAKKGALLRAGLRLLATHDDADFVRVLADLPTLA